MFISSLCHAPESWLSSHQGLKPKWWTGPPVGQWAFRGCVVQHWWIPGRSVIKSWATEVDPVAIGLTTENLLKIYYHTPQAWVCPCMLGLRGSPAQKRWEMTGFTSLSPMKQQGLEKERDAFSQPSLSLLKRCSCQVLTSHRLLWTHQFLKALQLCPMKQASQGSGYMATTSYHFSFPTGHAREIGFYSLVKE